MKNKLAFLIPFLLVSFLVFWITVSHLIKKNLIKTINYINDDNLKVFYQDVTLSGFPFKFQINFVKPTIKLINENEIKGFVFDRVSVNLDLKMQNLYLSTNQKFQYKKHYSNGNLISEHNIEAEEPIKISIDFEKSIATLSKPFKASENLKSFLFPKTNFNLSSNNEVYARIEGFSLEANKVSFQDNQLIMKYMASANYFDMQHDNKKFHFLLDSDITRYIPSDKNEQSYFTNIGLKDFNIRIMEDNSELDLNGNLSFPSQRQSIGLLNLAIWNYQSFINLITKGNPKTRAFLNNFVVKANFDESKKENFENSKKVVKFTIKFTEDGIYFGNIEMNKLISESLNE